MPPVACGCARSVAFFARLARRTAAAGGRAAARAYGRRVPDPRRHLGRLGEQLALEHLERLGYALVARNHRTRFGELDLVVCDGQALVFVEVKTRRASHPGRAWEGLHPRKRERVRRMARAYLAEAEDRPRAAALRFDAIGVTIDARGRLVALEHLEGAF